MEEKERLLPNATLSHYRIVSKIGEGGMGKRLAPNDPVKASETASATSICCVRGEKKRAAALLRHSFKSQAQAR
jgi:hypothetical protein